MIQVVKLLSSLKNSELYLKNKVSYDYKAYKGEIADIREAYVSNDIQYFIDFWNSKNQEKYFEMKHPIFNNITTRAVFSVQLNLANFVFMIDKKNKYPWIIGQCQSLVDSVIVEDKLYIISTVMQVDLLNQIDKLHQISSNDIYFQDIEFGYILSQNRPFHHFYDQLRYFYNMDKPKKIFNNSSFFIPNHAEKTSEKLVYFFPTGICVNQVGSRSAYAKTNSIIADILDDNLENQILKDSLGGKNYANISKKYELNLWFSICSEKRVWLQQVDGYVNIIRKLLKHFSNIRVFFDGITAKENETINYEVDYQIYKKISFLLRDYTKEECDLVPLIGVDYKTKINYALEIDFFIASGGTAPIVPSRICKKHGIIIGNSITYNLGMKNSNVIINKERIQDVIISKNPSFMDFHISWEYIFDFMCRHFKLELDNKIPSNDEVVLHWLSNSIKDINKQHSWKFFLLELVCIFEKANLIDIADNLLEKILVFLDEDTKNKYIDKRSMYQEYCSKKQFELSISTLKSTLSRLELQLQNKTNELKNLQESITHKKQLLEVQNLEQDVNLKYLKAKEIQENINLKTLEKTKIQKELEQYSNNIVYIERYHQSAKQRIYNHLSYKLGFCAIKNSKTFLGWIAMPITLLGILIAHKQEQKIYQEKIQLNPSLRLPSLESYIDYQEAKKEENSFTYKLGQAIINANKTWYKGGYVRLIFEIRKIKLEFKTKREKK
ncbi:hypothetical protein ACNGBE_04485 [Campylobacter coli]